MNLLIIIVLLLGVSWNSAFAQPPYNLLDVKSFYDYNNDETRQPWERYLTQKDGHSILVGVESAENGCDVNNLDNLFFHPIDNDPNTFLRMDTDKCYWITVYDDNAQELLLQGLWDTFFQVGTVQDDPYRIEIGFDAAYIYLPFVN